MIAACARAGVYPTRHWTYRVKPNVRQDTVLFLKDGSMVLQSERDVVHVVNPEDGSRLWEYALEGPAQLFPVRAGQGTDLVLAATESILHALDVKTHRRLWSAPTCGGLKYTLHRSVEAPVLEVRCEGREPFSLSIKDGAPTQGPEQSPAMPNPAAPAVFDPAIMGPDTEIVFQSEKVSLRDKGEDKWTYAAKDPFAHTAALLKGKLYLLTSGGRLITLDTADGSELSVTNLTRTIDMRFWDELPENVNNYSRGALFAGGEFLYVIGPSSLSQFKILPFPEEISLSSDGPSDTTAQWHLNRAIAAWDESNFVEALRGFKEVAETFPESPDVQMFLGMAYSALREADPTYLDLAIQHLETALEMDPLNPDIAANLMGNYLIKIMAMDPNFQKKQILKIYQDMQRVAPTSMIPYMGLAEIYLADKNYTAAAAVLEKSLEYGFFGIDQLNLFLATLYMSNDYEKALDTATRTLKLFPKSRTAFILKAKLHCKQGEYKKAIHTFEAAPTEDSDDTGAVSTFPKLLTSGAEFFYGNALGLAGYYKKGVQHLQDFVNSLPTEAEIKRIEAFVTEDPENPSDEDIALMERFGNMTYIQLRSESDFRIPAMLSAAHFQYRAGNIKKSLAQLKAVEESGADDLETRSYIGYFYALNGRELDKALDYTKKAYDTAPQDVVFVKNYAVALWRNKKREQAEEKFKEALALEAPTEFLHYEYGLFLLEQKDSRDRAVEQFLEEYEISPEVALVLEKLKELKVDIPEK